MSQLLSVRGGPPPGGRGHDPGGQEQRPAHSGGHAVGKGAGGAAGLPRLRDVDASIRILRHLAATPIGRADALAVDTTALRRCEISDVLMREMRSSAIFLGAILAGAGRRT